MATLDTLTRTAAATFLRSADQPARIGELAENRLRGNAYLALRHVACEGHDGVVVLRGCVPTYYLKQVAQEVVAQTDGVRQVVNHIEVMAATASGFRGS
jgi:osmotically-inducible protein OsmY